MPYIQPTITNEELETIRSNLLTNRTVTITQRSNCEGWISSDMDDWIGHTAEVYGEIYTGYSSRYNPNFVSVFLANSNLYGGQWNFPIECTSLYNTRHRKLTKVYNKGFAKFAREHL